MRTTPTCNVTPNSIYNAIAVPKTSYISDPIIATSAITHKHRDVFLEKPILIKLDISVPVTIPSLAAKVW